ncbi:MAG: diguanylate cyclase domain-containing protein, partial [Sphingomicrobium sp.]
MSSASEQQSETPQRSRLLAARREAVVLSILIAAVMLLIWNGSAFFQHLRIAGPEFDRNIQLASTALTLNVALILFGWRRYVDLQHEAELRADGERRAAVLASSDSATGLYNRKGFADHADTLSKAGQQRGDQLVIVSIQIHRFKAVNDQHGYDMGDRLLREIAGSLNDALGPDSVIARLSGDEFAVAVTLAPSDLARADLTAEAVLRAITRPFLLDDRMIQVGAFAGIAATPAGEVR